MLAGDSAPEVKAGQTNMSKAFLGVFTLIAAGGVAGVDYVNQTHKADLPIGQMSAADYLATLNQRLTGTQQVRAEGVTVRAVPDGSSKPSNTGTAPLGGGGDCSALGKAKLCVSGG